MAMIPEIVTDFFMSFVATIKITNNITNQIVDKNMVLITSSPFVKILPNILSDKTL